MDNKNRHDAWNHEDDLILADTILKHIRDGSTQLAAFKEVATILNRTPAACGFRWNASIRKKYKNEIAKAKQRRNLNKQSKKSSKTLSRKDKTLKDNTNSNLLEVIKTLRLTIIRLENQVEKLTEELNKKESEIEQLKQQQKPEHIIAEDYQQFLQILTRAREMGIFEKIS